MIKTLQQFFAMGGYGMYVWLSYGSVFLFLFIQLFIPWRRWLSVKRNDKTQQTS
jgi:heme exporter protein CcmD